MITKFIKETFLKYFTKYYNLPPKQKAFCDMVGIFMLIFFVGFIVGMVAHFGLWVEFFILWVLYFIGSMVNILYKSRVRYYEIEEKYYKNK